MAQEGSPAEVFPPARPDDRRTGGRGLLVMMALVLIAPLGVVAARQIGPGNGSPATGHAQVVTQGIAALPQEEMVWRLVERTAEPRNQAQFGERVLSFVMASDEPILLTDETADGVADVARLAPGEARLVQVGTRQKRASLSDAPATYLALELVPAGIADNVGSGTLLFTTAPFMPPPGDRDVDLVRDVLSLSESSIVPDSGQATVILATDGAVEVVPSGGRGRTLQVGEAGIFTGELTIAAVAPAGANAARASIVGFMRPAGQQSAGGAAFVAGVIGVEIPPLTATSAPQQPTTAPSDAAPTEIVVETATETATIEPTATETATPTATATATPTATPTRIPGSGPPIVLTPGRIVILPTATTRPAG